MNKALGALPAAVAAYLDPPAAPPEHEGRLKKHIVEKKTEEYKEYANQSKALIQQYVSPDRELLGQAYDKGNIMLGPQPGCRDSIASSFPTIFDKATT